MEVFDFILDGLEKALELERELGVRTVELGPDGRKLLLGEPSVNTPVPTQTLKHSNTQTISDLVFLHDRPLSPKGVEMMAKILDALGTPEAPIVVTPPAPQAKVTVVLGGLALKKYFPGMKGEPGQWQKTPEKRDVLITYSPEYILRFGTVTPVVEKIKQDMWRSLKAVKQRLAVSG